MYLQGAPKIIPKCNGVVYNFIYSEKATKFCEIFTLLLTVCTVVTSKVKHSQTFVVFSEYMNFIMSKLENQNKSKDNFFEKKLT